MNIELLVLTRVAEAESADREREALLPYVMVCEDTTSRHLTFAGPYASAAAAEAAVAYETDRSGDESLRFFSAPLFPPLSLADAVEDAAVMPRRARP